MASKELMLLVAQLKFNDGLSNSEVAEELRGWGYEISTKSSRPVQKLIHETGRWLVREYDRLQTIEASYLTGSVIADHIKEKYGLLKVMLVPGGQTTNESQYADLIKLYGQQAAIYIERDFTEAEEKNIPFHVAISGGQTITELVSALPERRRTNVHYYAAAMLGRGSTNWTSHVGPEMNATTAWARSGRIPKHLYFGTVSPYDIDPDHLKGESKQRLHEWVRGEIITQVAKQTSSREVAYTMRVLNENVNMAIASLGTVLARSDDANLGEAHVERLTMTNLLKRSQIDLNALSREGAVGELSYCFFDKHGACNPKWNFFLTAGAGTEHSGVAFYQRLVAKGHKVIVMAGERQLHALIPAMEAKMFNVLITDEHTAYALSTEKDFIVNWT